MNGFSGMGTHHSARPTTEEWLTPPSVMDALGEFDLDPCSPIDRPWPTARHHYTIEDNGLILPWFGRVWLNPPYTHAKLMKWMGRMVEHSCGIALIFARTETAAFHRYVWEASSAALFLEGRLNFHRVSGERSSKNAGAPSVLCAYGHADAAVLAECGLRGSLVLLQVPRLFAIAAVTATWRDLIIAYVAQKTGPVHLSALYRAFAGHPKAKANRNLEAKIRQELQRGPYRRVGRGLWEMD